MSTRIVRSVNDFLRHRIDVELVCGCGHKAALPYLDVVMHFHRMNWSPGLEAAARRFRCTRCGARPARVGPAYR